MAILGGTDTVSANLKSFILAMVLYPDIQKTAQAQLRAESKSPQDSLQVPEFDPEQHPYLMALIMEVLRWSAAVPIGGPHLNASSDVYRGWEIPGGSTIIPNVWGMCHDEVCRLFVLETCRLVFKVARSRMCTLIQRRLDLRGFYGAMAALMRMSGIRATLSLVLEGGGSLSCCSLDVSWDSDRAFPFSRACPGRKLALASLWTNIAAILMAFDIGEVPGLEDRVKKEFVHGMLM
jgi:hypothetical protein